MTINIELKIKTHLIITFMRIKTDKIIINKQMRNNCD